MLILIYAVSLISCDVADYALGKDRPASAWLISISDSTHNDSASTNAASASADCPCVCHVPTLPAVDVQVTAYASFANSPDLLPSFAPSASVSSVYHPPKAS